MLQTIGMAIIMGWHGDKCPIMNRKLLNWNFTIYLIDKSIDIIYTTSVSQNVIINLLFFSRIFKLILSVLKILLLKINIKIYYFILTSTK